jgi:hypothetical protein
MTMLRRYATCPDCQDVLDAPEGWEFNTDTALCDDCYVKRYGKGWPRFGENEIEYGRGDCPTLGGKPTLLNCGFCEDADDCGRQGIVPTDDEDHYERREQERERFGRQNDAWVEHRSAI